MNRPTPKEMRAACDRFNAQFKPGDAVVVYTGIRGMDPKLAEVRCPAEILGGHTPVVYVIGGHHGCVALTHTAKP